MKKDIHPEYKRVTTKCQTCGKEFEFGTAADKIAIDVCSGCHPFFTGNLQSTKATGRVERFKRMQEAAKKANK